MATEDVFAKNVKPKSMSIVSGRREIFTDSFGKQTLDFCSQTLNLSLGHCHPDVNAAVSKALNDLTFTSSRFQNEYVSKLAKTLTDNAPLGLSKINLKITSGTLANEGALKAAYKYTGRRGVVSLLGSHHGQSIETMQVSGKHFDRTYLSREHVHFVDPVDHAALPSSGPSISLSAAREICRHVESHRNKIAAVIIEPVMVDAGVLLPEPGSLELIRECTTDNDVVLIFDEVQTACGWTGELFGADYFKVTPDILTASKGLAAGLPLALMLMRPHLDVLEYGEHEITHGAHILSCAAALANMHLLTASNLLESVRENGEYLRSLLRKLQSQHRSVSAVRGIGFINGLELDDPVGEMTEKISSYCLANGLLVRTSKVGERTNVLQIKPPLITSRESIEEAVSILGNAISEHGA